MSFDLAVWSASLDLSHKTALDLYVSLCEGKAEHPIADAGVDEFYRDLTSQHPELDAVPDDEVDSCPWSAGFDRSPGHLIMCMSWSRANDMFHLVRGLAEKHNVSVFDPQQGRLIYPPGTPLELSHRGDVWPGLVTALQSLLKRTNDNSFVIIEDKATSHFVQFGGGGSFVIDLPLVALSDIEKGRAADVFGGLGVDAPEGDPGGFQFYQCDLGKDPEKAATTALRIFAEVYQQDRQYLDTQEN